MERKNRKGWAILRTLSRIAISTFCLTLATTFLWQNRTFGESVFGNEEKATAAGCQTIACEGGESAPPCIAEDKDGATAEVDPSPDDVGDLAVFLPSPTPAVTDFPVDKPPTALNLSYLKREERFHPLIVRVSKKHNVDPALVKAIIMAESGYNPHAVSKVGASGLMQLMPKTAGALGVQDIFDPEENVSGGVKYLKKLLNEFGGEIKLALAAYNAGSRKVKTYNGVPPIGATQLYINKVIEYYHHYRKRLVGPKENV